MKYRNVIIVTWLGIMALVIASLAMTAKVQAQCDPATGACPPPSSGGGSGGKKRPTAIPPTATATPTMTQPFLPLMPLSGGSGGTNHIVPTINGTTAALETMVAKTETAKAPTPTATKCVLCPAPNIPPTIVAGPVFLRPGVINMIIGALVVVVAGALILVFRNR